MGLFAFQLMRTSRDALRQEPGPGKEQSRTAAATIPVTRSGRVRPAAPTDWLVAARLEMGWHLQRTVRGAGLWILARLTHLICAAYPAIHSESHRDGPLLPITEQLLWVVFEGGFMTLMAAAAIFAGFIFRRERQGGCSEMIDSAEAPLAVRLSGQIAALVILLAGLSLGPGLSLITLQLVTPDVPAKGLDAFVFSLSVMLPAIIEMACPALLLHALIRSAGLACALSLFLVFFVVASHEAQLIHHPLISFGLPPHVLLSELSGWSPWAPAIATTTACKLALCAMLLALVWAILPWGTDLGMRARFGQVFRQARPGPVLALFWLCRSSLLPAESLKSGKSGWEPIRARLKPRRRLRAMRPGGGARRGRCVSPVGTCRSRSMRTSASGSRKCRFVRCTRTMGGSIWTCRMG